MKRPPAILTLWSARDNGRPLRLWLPLFLLWPVVLLVAIVIMPFWLLFALACWIGGRGTNALRAPWRAILLVCSLPGLRVTLGKSNGKELHVGFC